MKRLPRAMWIERGTADATAAFQWFVYAKLSVDFDIAEDAREVLHGFLGDDVDGNLS